MKYISYRCLELTELCTILGHYIHIFTDLQIINIEILTFHFISLYFHSKNMYALFSEKFQSVTTEIQTLTAYALNVNAFIAKLKIQ